MIITREKLPGTRLVISELEEELGIGKGPIREALMRLDRSGLMRNIPYKGAVVAEAPRMREIEIIYEMRVKLETTLALEAMQNMDEQGIAKLESMLSEMQPGLDLQFHPPLVFHYSEISSFGQQGDLIVAHGTHGKARKTWELRGILSSPFS